MSSETYRSRRVATYTGIALLTWAILLGAWAVNLMVDTGAILTYTILITPLVLVAVLFVRRRPGVASSVLAGTAASLVTAYALLVIFGQPLN